MQISRTIPFNTFLLFFITSCAILNAQPIARVQSVHTYTYPGNTVTFPGNNAAGNAIVVMASWYAAPGTPTISDTRGNTYTMLPALTGGGAGNGEQTSILIWYALNIAAGANTVMIGCGKISNAYLACALSPRCSMVPLRGPHPRPRRRAESAGSWCAAQRWSR